MSYYDIQSQEDNVARGVVTPFTPDTRVQAAIGPRTFTGRVLEAGYDGEPVVYIKDSAGHERAVRSQRETHAVEPIGGETL